MLSPAHVQAVVTHEHDGGARGQAQLLHRVQQPPNLPIIITIITIIIIIIIITIIIMMPTWWSMKLMVA